MVRNGLCTVKIMKNVCITRATKTKWGWASDSQKLLPWDSCIAQCFLPCSKLLKNNYCVTLSFANVFYSMTEYFKHHSCYVKKIGIHPFLFLLITCSLLKVGSGCSLLGTQYSRGKVGF